MDGLLLDTEPLYRRASAQASRQMGYEIGDEVYASLVGRGAADVERLLYEALGQDFPMADFRQRWREQWALIVETDGIALKSGAMALLERLRALAMPIAIATSTHRERASTALGFARLESMYDHLVCGDEVSQGKPAPEIYLRAASALGIAPERCLAFEDSPPGVRSASAAGMRVIMVPDLTPASVSEREMTYQVAESLGEILKDIEAP